jgi:methylmalonyl-CoA carboxyltransferase large subunit
MTQTEHTTAEHTTTEHGTDTTTGQGTDTTAGLRALVGELAARVQLLEEQAASRHPEVSEDVLLAISAACAAYLGERATIKQVHLRRGGGWASQGRAAAQQSHAELHGYGDRQAPLTQIPRRGTT